MTKGIVSENPRLTADEVLDFLLASKQKVVIGYYSASDAKKGMRTKIVWDMLIRRTLVLTKRTTAQAWRTQHALIRNHFRINRNGPVITKGATFYEAIPLEAERRKRK